MQLSVKDASQLLNVTEKTIYRWIQTAGLPAYRVEGLYRINKSLLLEWATTKRINISPTLFEEKTRLGILPSLAQTLESGGVHYRVEGTDKASVLRALVRLLHLPETVDREFLFQALLAREALSSTGIGDGIAIPHVRNPVILEVDRPEMTLSFLESPVEFEAIDGRPVDTLFTFITPTVRAHLHLLSRLSFCLRDDGFKSVLRRQGRREEIMSAIQRVELTIRPPVGTEGSPEASR